MPKGNNIFTEKDNWNTRFCCRPSSITNGTWQNWANWGDCSSTVGGKLCHTVLRISIGQFKYRQSASFLGIILSQLSKNAQGLCEFCTDLKWFVCSEIALLEATFTTNSVRKISSIFRPCLPMSADEARTDWSSWNKFLLSKEFLIHPLNNKNQFWCRVLVQWLELHQAIRDTRERASGKDKNCPKSMFFANVRQTNHVHSCSTNHLFTWTKKTLRAVA